MTMIGIAVFDNGAEIMTDSACYTRTMSELSTASKLRHFTHLDAVLVSQGDHEFGSFAAAIVEVSGVVTFDQLMEVAPEALGELWHRQTSGRTRPTDDSTIFLVGYSEGAGSFKGFVLASEHGFRPEPIGMFLMPSPSIGRPSDLELARMRRSVTEKVYGRHVSEILANIDEWAAQPPLQTPAGVDGWVPLAQMVREQRALKKMYYRVPVAGKVWLTQLVRGAATTQVVHEFDDSGEEFQQLIHASLHPQAQLGPCWCGSGDRYLSCHLALELDDPCRCKSGRLLRVCCAITPPESDETTGAARAATVNA